MLLDSLGKRVDWLRETCDDMGLSRVTCVHARAEEFAGEHRQAYDMATSRAVAALPLLSELALPLVKVGGCFLAMKSVDSDAEIDSARGAIGQLGGKIEAIREMCIRDSIMPGAVCSLAVSAGALLLTDLFNAVAFTYSHGTPPGEAMWLTAREILLSLPFAMLVHLVFSRVHRRFDRR